MRRSFIIAVSLLAGCRPHGADNARAKERLFARAGDPRSLTAAPVAIDLRTLGGSPTAQDALLEMTETDAAERVGSFRLQAKLSLRFEGSGQTFAIDEERLVEQSKTGDLHLRIHDADGGGMEILWFGGKAYGRSRYGNYVARDRQSGLGEQRDEVFGALRTLYLMADRAFVLRGLGPADGCERFEIRRGDPRSAGAPPRFQGRLDSDTTRRFQFVYGRQLTQANGELCVDPRGFVRRAHVSLRWSAAGDAGSGTIQAELTETTSDLGGEVHLAAPENPEPEPHRPRGPFATLSRFGFVARPDGGQD